jgi:cytochrome P450
MYIIGFFLNKISIAIKTLNKMKYLTSVVKEAIRITPPVGGGYRKALKTFEIDVSIYNFYMVIF